MKTGYGNRHGLNIQALILQDHEAVSRITPSDYVLVRWVLQHFIQLANLNHRQRNPDPELYEYITNKVARVIGRRRVHHGGNGDN